MATSSNIIVHLSDGTWKSVYCHWDGYLSHNGKILFEHYNSQERAEELVKEGDLSQLQKECTKPEGHSYERPTPGHCVYYNRDRDEAGAKGTIGSTLESVWDLNDANFVYVWDAGRWLYKPFKRFAYEGTSGLEPLAMVLC